MREMKDSGIEWIGEIPSDWKRFRGKNILRIIAGFPADSTLFTFEESAIPLIRIRDINKEDTEVKYAGTVPSEFIIEKDDILVGMDGDFNVALWKGSRSALNQRVCKIEVNNFIANKLFIFYCLPEILKHINDITYGTTVKHLSTFDIDNYYFLIPPIEEQQVIADFLEKKCGEIDGLIGLQEEMITKLEDYRKSVITETVTRGLNPDVPLRDSGIDWLGQVPEYWQIMKFKNLFNTIKGLSITKADLIVSGSPVISYGQIHSKINNGTEVKQELIRYVPEELICESALAEVGDFIFADTSEDLEGSGNAIYIDKFPVYGGYHTIVAHSKELNDNKYLAYLFQSNGWRKEIRSVVTGIKVFTISQAILNETILVMPTVSEQQNIVKYLDKKCGEIDLLIKVKREKIEKLKDYKKSLIFEYVTGKKSLINN